MKNLDEIECLARDLLNHKWYIDDLPSNTEGAYKRSRYQDATPPDVVIEMIEHIRSLQQSMDCMMQDNSVMSERIKAADELSSMVSKYEDYKKGKWSYPYLYVNEANENYRQLSEVGSA